MGSSRAGSNPARSGSFDATRTCQVFAECHNRFTAETAHAPTIQACIQVSHSSQIHASFTSYHVRMAERSKALRSGRSLVLQAWVRIPLLTKVLHTLDTPHIQT